MWARLVVEFALQIWVLEDRREDSLFAAAVTGFGAVAGSADSPPAFEVESRTREAFAFSSGVLVGNTLYIAGTTGVGPDTKTPVGAAEEARLVLDERSEE